MTALLIFRAIGHAFFGLLITAYALMASKLAYLKLSAAWTSRDEDLSTTALSTATFFEVAPIVIAYVFAWVMWKETYRSIASIKSKPWQAPAWWLRREDQG